MKRTVGNYRHAALCAGTAVPFAFILVALATDWTQLWGAVGIRSFSPPFMDLRSIPGAVDALTLGLNPFVENPGDPWNRPFTYPRVWIAAASTLNLSQEGVVWIGLLFAAMFLVCVYGLLRNLKGGYEAIFIFCALYSNSTLLALERGNNDLFIFTLACLAACWAGTRLLALATCATILKLYPLVTVAASFWDPRTNRMLWCASVALLAVYIALSLNDILLIREASEFSSLPSYGITSMASTAPLVSELPPTTANALLFAALAVAGGLSFLLGWRTGTRTGARADEHISRLFVFGASIYTATFIAGFNWDYRLIFLILAIPYLCVFWNDRAHRLAARATLVASIVSMNHMPLISAFGDAGNGAASLAKCAAFAGCLYFLPSAIHALRGPSTTHSESVTS